MENKDLDRFKKEVWEFAVSQSVWSANKDYVKLDELSSFIRKWK